MSDLTKALIPPSPLNTSNFNAGGSSLVKALIPQQSAPAPVQKTVRPNLLQQGETFAGNLFTNITNEAGRFLQPKIISPLSQPKQTIPASLKPQQKQLPPVQIPGGLKLSITGSQPASSAQLKTTPVSLNQQKQSVQKTQNVANTLGNIGNFFDSIIKQGQEGITELSHGIVPNQNQVMPKQEYTSPQQYAKALNTSQQANRGVMSVPSEINKSLGIALSKIAETESLGILKSNPVPTNAIEKTANAIGTYAPLVAVPVKTLINFGAVHLALQTAFHALTGKNQVSELLPQNSPQWQKTGVDLIQFLGEAILAHGLGKVEGPIFDKFTKNVIEEYHLPETIQVTPEGVRNVVKGIDTGSNKQALSKLDMTSSQWRTAATEGVNVTLPTQKVITITDKPFWAKIKSFVNLEPTNTVIKTSQAGTPIQQFGGYLKPGEFDPQEVINNVMKTGADKTPEGQQVIKTAVEAQRTGKTLTVENSNIPDVIKQELQKENVTPENIHEIARKYDVNTPQTFSSKGQEGSFNQLLTNPKEMTDKYLTANTKEGQAIHINVDNAKELFIGYNKVNAPQYDMASGNLSKLAYREALIRTQNNDKPILVSSGGSGSGKSSVLGNTLKDYSIYLDSNLGNYDRAKQFIDEGLKTGKEVHVKYIYRHPVDAFINGVLRRFDNGEPRTVPINTHVEQHGNARDTIIKLAQHYKNNPHVFISFFDNNNGAGNAKETTLDFVKGLEYNKDEVNDTLRQHIKERYKQGGLTTEQYKALAGDTQQEVSGRTEPGSTQVKTAAKTTKLTPEEQEVTNMLREAIASGDYEAATALHASLSQELPNIPRLEDIQAEVEAEQEKVIAQAERELSHVTTLDMQANPDDPTNNLRAIADALADHFKRPKAIFKITGKERKYSVDVNGREASMIVGGDTKSALDKLIYSSDIVGLKNNLQVLSEKFDKNFTTLYNKNIDGGDYEQFKQRFQHSFLPGSNTYKPANKSAAPESDNSANGGQRLQRSNNEGTASGISNETTQHDTAQGITQADQSTLNSERSNNGNETIQTSESSDNQAEVKLEPDNNSSTYLDYLSEHSAQLDNELHQVNSQLDTTEGEERNQAVMRGNELRGELNKLWYSNKAETVLDLKNPSGYALPLAEIQVFRYSDGTYAMRHSVNVGQGAQSTPFGGRYETRAEAIAAGKENILSYVDSNLNGTTTTGTDKRLLTKISREVNNIAENNADLFGQEIPQKEEKPQQEGLGIDEGILSPEERTRLFENIRSEKATTTETTAQTPLETGIEKKTNDEMYNNGLFSSKGQYAQLENQTEKQAEEATAEPGVERPIHQPQQLNVVEFPELVRMVKELTGKYPELKNFQHDLQGQQRGDVIQLGRRLFEQKDLLQKAKVLAHELGHLADILPEGKRSRSNLLGRIASLNNFLSHTLKEFPESIDNRLTPEDREAIRKRAIALSKEPVTLTETQVIGQKDIEPGEIKAIWNDITAAYKDPELLRYIQNLTDEQKKDLVVQAMQGKVADWVTLKRDITETITHTVIKNAPEDIRNLYRKLLQDEILARRLHDLRIIKGELWTLSKKWRPYNPMFDNTAYRRSSSELYADAISVLFNDPVLLKQDAPAFWKAFFSYIDQKPEVADNFFKTWDLLTKGNDEVQSERRRIINEAFATGEEKWAALRQEESNKKQNFLFQFKYDFIDKNQKLIDLIKQAKKEGKIVRDDTNPEYLLNGRSYLAGRIKYMLESSINPVYQTLEKNGLTTEQLGELNLYQRVISAPERSDIANPFGLDKKTASDTLENLRKEIGDEKLAILDKQATITRDIMKSYLKEAYELPKTFGFGSMYSDELYKEMSTNPAYATFAVIDYLEKYISAHIYQGTGTLKEIANPFTSTVMKMVSIIRALEHQKAKLGTFAFLKEHFPDEITQADKRWNGRTQEVVESEDPNKVLVKYIDKGKVEGFYVDPFIASSLNYETPDRINLALKVLKILNGASFRPLFITFNTGFQTFNFARDFERYVKNHPDNVVKAIPMAIKAYINALPPAFARAFDRPNTLIQEMENAKVLSITYNDLLHGQTNEDKQLEALLKHYNIIEHKENKLAILKPFLAVLDFIERTGNMIETLPKVAGYQTLKGRMPDNELADFIRSYLGSPDFLKGGGAKWWSNEVFLFSNAITQGIRADYHIAFQSPHSRSGYWFKTSLMDFLPKVLMFAAAAGFMGAYLKKQFSDVSEYDKTNYTIIPFGEENGKTTYLRVPTDDTARFTGGLFWKALNLFAGHENSNIQDSIFQLLSYAGGQFPSLTPTLQVTAATAQFMGGQNPYDFYRGRTIIPQQDFSAGGMTAAQPFFTWVIQNLGANIILGSSVTEKTGGTKGWLQNLVEQPLLSNIVGRWVKVSNYGQTEQNNMIKAGITQQNAQRALQENQSVSNAIKQYQAGDKSDTSRIAVEKQMIQQTVGTIHNQATLDQARQMLQKFKLAVQRGKNDPNVNAIIDATTIKEKVLIMQRIQSEMPHDEWVKYRTSLLNDGILSTQAIGEMHKAGL